MALIEAKGCQKAKGWRKGAKQVRLDHILPFQSLIFLSEEVWQLLVKRWCFLLTYRGSIVFFIAYIHHECILAFSLAFGVQVSDKLSVLVIYACEPDGSFPLLRVDVKDSVWGLSISILHLFMRVQFELLLVICEIGVLGNLSICVLALLRLHFILCLF